jgi:uncharacterized membrane protein YuzA (DUF378 family)
MNAAMLGLISWILVIIGGINWLLIGLLNLNIVSMIFGESIIARIIYILVGLGACYLIYAKFKKPNTTGV